MSASADSSSGSRYFKLGLFMLVGVALLVGGVIVLGAGALFRHTIPAETLVYESVSGLEIGSAVKYRGVPIGKVTAIRFSSTKYGLQAESAEKDGGKDIRGILIEMSLTQDALPGQSEQQIVEETHRLIDKGLRARVTPAGISGQSYVDCDILDAASHPPPPIAWEPTSLYIPSAPSTLVKVMDTAEQIAAELKKADLGKVIGHVDELTASAAAAFRKVDKLVDANQNQVSRTLAELPDTAARLRATAARAEAILSDPRVDKAMASLSSVGDTAKATLADVQGLTRDARQLLAGETDTLRSIVADLRRLAADGAALVEDARQNPSRVLFGKPPSPDAGR